MGVKIKPFNPLNHLLHSDEEVAEYLSEAYMDDDPAVFIVALGHVVKHRGVANVAEATGLGRESLYKAISGKTQPRWDTVHRLLKALNIRLIVA